MIRALAIALLTVAPLTAADEPLTVQKIRYDDLGKFVVASKGKVIVVDFWTSTCGPCKEGLLHMREIYPRLKGQGLVAITVSLDDPSDTDAVGAAQKWLRDNKIALTDHFNLDEDIAVWSKKLGTEAVPCVYVFNRAGQIEEKFLKKPDSAVLDRLLERLLREKTPQ